MFKGPAAVSKHLGQFICDCRVYGYNTGKNETIKTDGEGVYWPARGRFMPLLVFNLLA